ncbi:hypothetical protein CLHUN_02020 [Ruminiclostridium hungatei]|uniref:Uncharacterized protein n=1 Tax=Ruminiclostridium hungatei TaxID=48256 RepID=A0A1V4SSE5_RUMHU|nr:hypothetical protein [Ruminiclostridium hungatei]OPX46386.1 hypothetical protein CLHUN_02020 [Ruminiclostridium hungatei]
MLIGINSNFEIMQINSISDSTLTQVEVDRYMVFGDFSDIRILNYCYKPTGNGYSIYPAIGIIQIELLEKQLQINSLQQQVNDLTVAIAAIIGGAT